VGSGWGGFDFYLPVYLEELALIPYLPDRGFLSSGIRPGNLEWIALVRIKPTFHTFPFFFTML